MRYPNYLGSCVSPFGSTWLEKPGFGDQIMGARSPAVEISNF